MLAIGLDTKAGGVGTSVERIEMTDEMAEDNDDATDDAIVFEDYDRQRCCRRESAPLTDDDGNATSDVDERGVIDELAGLVKLGSKSGVESVVWIVIIGIVVAKGDATDENVIDDDVDDEDAGDEDAANAAGSDDATEDVGEPSRMDRLPLIDMIADDCVVAELTPAVDRLIDWDTVLLEEDSDEAALGATTALSALTMSAAWNNQLGSQRCVVSYLFCHRIHVGLHVSSGDQGEDSSVDDAQVLGAVDAQMRVDDPSLLLR